MARDEGGTYIVDRDRFRRRHDEERCAAPRTVLPTKGHRRGTGLGLSMVHGFAEQSGGKFFLHSQKDKGTTAELWLPTADAQAKAQANVQALGQTIDDVKAGSNPLVVLAVDDDYLVLTNTVAMLEDLGHKGVAASSAKEALDILRQGEPIDLVVTDQAMPYDGHATCQGSRRLLTPIILSAGLPTCAECHRICRRCKNHLQLARRLRASPRRPALDGVTVRIAARRQFLIRDADAAAENQISAFPAAKQQEKNRDEGQRETVRNDHSGAQRVSNEQIIKFDQNDQHIGAGVPPDGGQLPNLLIAENVDQAHNGRHRRHHKSGAKQPGRNIGPGRIACLPKHQIKRMSRRRTRWVE